jgi:hypothetical protein
MHFSRYYLPKTPETRGSFPNFTSQSLADSLRGSSGSACSERVTLVRVSWNAFTPRFMHEWKLPSESGYIRMDSPEFFSQLKALNGKSVKLSGRIRAGGKYFIAASVYVPLNVPSSPPKPGGM